MSTTDNPDHPDNVIPPNELERRRRVLQLTEDMADFCKDLYERALELSELGVPVADWMALLAEHAPPRIQAMVATYGKIAGPLLDGFLSARRAGAKTPAEGVASAMADLFGRGMKAGYGKVPPEPPGPFTNEELALEDNYSISGLRMKRVIARLFESAPKMTDASGKADPAQAPALECHIMLKSGGGIQGALSVTPEGTLRLLAANQIGQKPIMVEHFFDYEEVADIAVFREVKASEGPRIITS